MAIVLVYGEAFGGTERRKLKNSIRRAFWRWFGHQKNVVDGGAQAPQSGQVASKMRNDNTVYGNPAIGAGCDQPVGFQSNLANSIEQPNGAGVFKVKEGRVSAGDGGDLTRVSGNILGDDWRSHCGFIGHDGLPWLFDDDAQDWLPVTQTKWAGRYAAMQKRAS